MARSRNIKPAFFKNEYLGVEDPYVSLLYIGLWCLADKNGMLEDRPLRIKAELFPYRDNFDINGYLTVLERLGNIRRFTYQLEDQINVIELVNFKKHQNPHHTEKGELIPCFSDSCVVTVKERLDNGYTPADSLNTDSLNTDSLVLIPDLASSKKTALSKKVKDDSEVIFYLPTNKEGEFYNVTKNEIDQWILIYPAVYIEQEIRNMIGWAMSNPKKRKTSGGMKSFINAWLSKSQNKPQWRTYRLDKMYETKIRPIAQRKNRPLYNPNDSRLSQIDATMADFYTTGEGDNFTLEKIKQLVKDKFGINPNTPSFMNKLKTSISKFLNLKK